MLLQRGFLHDFVEHIDQKGRSEAEDLRAGVLQAVLENSSKQVSNRRLFVVTLVRVVGIIFFEDSKAFLLDQLLEFFERFFSILEIHELLKKVFNALGVH